MKRMLLVLVAVCAAPILAADPQGFVHWKGADLTSWGARLAPRMDARKLAAEQLGKFGNHSFMVSYREANGEAEVHESQSDVFVVEGGAATLVVGGTVEGGRSTAAGEIRGASINGGESRKLVLGDIVHIPAGMPHQLLLEPGQKFTYFVVKIDSK